MTTEEEKPFCGGDLKIERMVFCPSTKEHRSVLRDCQGCPCVDFVDEAFVKCNFKEEGKMSKKILVIPLPENFWKALALIVATGSTDALNAFKKEMQGDYEKDVIEFKTKVELRQVGSYLHGHQEPYLPLPKDFKRDEEVQVFVVREKKGSDERNKT